MDWFKESGKIISSENGWIELPKLLKAFDVSLQKAQVELDKDRQEDSIFIKGLKFDLALEIHINPINQETKIRLPSASRHIDDNFNEAHLSRISFEIGRVPNSIGN